MLLHKDVVASLIHTFQITFKTKKTHKNKKTNKNNKTQTSNSCAYSFNPKVKGGGGVSKLFSRPSFKKDTL